MSSPASVSFSSLSPYRTDTHIQLSDFLEDTTDVLYVTQQDKRGELALLRSKVCVIQRTDEDVPVSKRSKKIVLLQQTPHSTLIDALNSKWTQTMQGLELCEMFNEPLQPGMFAPGLTKLVFRGTFNRFNQPLKPHVFPPTLKHLEFGFLFNNPLDAEPGVLPASLETLRLGSMFNQPLKSFCFPAGLKHLEFSGLFNQPLVAGVLPTSLETLRFGNSFNQVLEPGVLPSGLIQLELGTAYSQPLKPGSLPSTLQLLSLDTSCSVFLTKDVLPRCTTVQFKQKRFSV